MAAAQPTYQDFFGRILRPRNLPSLKPEYERIEILVFRDPSNPLTPTQTIKIDTLYPYHTIRDLSTEIFRQTRMQPDFHPYHQCLLIPTKSEERPYLHFQYIFNDTNEPLQHPFTLMQAARPDPVFADVITPEPRGPHTLQTALFSTEKSVYTLHLFLYTDVYAAYQGVKPVSLEDWNGRFAIYFPSIEKPFESGEIPPSENAPLRVSRFMQRLTLMDRLDEILTGQSLRKPGETARAGATNLSSFRSIRIGWKQPVSNPLFHSFSIEEIFYDMPVSKIIPYIRFFSKSAPPVSKVFVDGPLNIPAMDTPEILLQWAQEDSITPQEDLIVAKVLVRPSAGNASPLYATFMIFEDGTAKFIIQPNEAMSNIPRMELEDVGELLQYVIGQVPKQKPKAGEGAASRLAPRSFYPVRNAYVDDLYVILNLGLDRDDPPITSKTLRKVLRFFRSFFQDTFSPIREQNPLAFLRYKCVDNFSTPSRDFQFLKRVMDLQKLSGIQNAPALEKYYMEEFDADLEFARSRVGAFFAKEGDFVLTDPEIRTFEQKENPGIDIAIFGKHPFYTFHLYRVNSFFSLESIKTLLSLLISVDPSTFEEDDDEAADALAEEQEEDERSAESVVGEPSTAGLEVAIAQQKPAEEVGDFLLDDFGSEDSPEDTEGLVVPAPPPKAPAPPLAQLAREDSAPLARAPLAPAASALASRAAKETNSDEEELAEDLSKKKLKQLAASFYFGARLTLYDNALFAYESVGANQYSRVCQSTQSRQPAVLSEEEYQELRDLYEEDTEAGDILWIEYPLKKGETIPKAARDDTETFTILRYGSRLDKQNVFLCSRFWCRRDSKIVLTKDFFSTKTRDGDDKPAETCPFCKDGLVKNLRQVVKGESVIERPTNKTEKRQTRVSFLKETGHPQGLYLPCCFIEKKKGHVEETHEAFKVFGVPPRALARGSSAAQAAAQAAATGAAAEEGSSEGEGAEGEGREGEGAKGEGAEEGSVDLPSMSVLEELSVGTKLIPANYAKRLAGIGTSYILSADKLPLGIMPRDGPRIGVLPAGINRYFTQHPKKLVKQDHINWKLMTDNVTGKPNVSGFFRIAAENRRFFLADSFLSAVAPFYGLNSAAELKGSILQMVQPPVFLALNYGNFLFDFYNPLDPEPPSLFLKSFALTRLGLNAIGIQKEAMIRVWKAFIAFERSIQSTEIVKEYRQYGPLFTQPLLVTTADGRPTANGIVFIVLEVNREGGVVVRCPPYGVSKEQAVRCDIAFLSYYPHYGFWEPIFYTRNQPRENIFDNTLVFRRDTFDTWPEIVKKRVEEFANMCHSSGLGMYTDSPRVDPNALIPLSTAVSVAGAEVYGILRDSYNHVSGVLYNVDETLVVVPCIDDGTIYPELQVELDWRNFMARLAKREVVETFYTTNLQPLLKALGSRLIEGYTLKELIRLDQTIKSRKDIYAYQLGNGLFIPMRQSDSIEGQVLESQRFREGQELPWMIDAKLVYGTKEPQQSLTMDHKEFNEIYQHLRLTFSNWLAMAPDTTKQAINEILFYNGSINSNIPIFEKRQRLFLRLGPEIERWLDDTLPAPARTPSLKRVDCRLIGVKEECTNACVWKEEGGQCLLHVPATYQVGNKADVPARELLVKKLIEELIRFPLKRDEILNQKVSQYQVLRDGFRSGNQYIVPENLPAWIELLRMDWRKQKKEQPKYVEEMTAIRPVEAAVEASKPRALALPEVLTSFFSDKKKGLYFIPSTDNTIWSLLRDDLGVKLDILVAERDIHFDIPVFTDVEDANEVAKMLQMGIYQLVYEEDTPAEPEEIRVKAVFETKQKAPVVILVQLPDGIIGAVSSAPDRMAPIPFDSLPANLKFNMSRTPSLKLS